MKSGVNNYYSLPQIQDQPEPAVLTYQLQREIHQLTLSFRKQIRNVIAVTRWLNQYQEPSAPEGTNALVLPALTGAAPEVLSFHLPASATAFKLFTDTLLRKYFYRFPGVVVHAAQQVLQLRVNHQDLIHMEYELSQLFESITPATYLETWLLSREALPVTDRIAS